jgi:plastocyanin
MPLAATMNNAQQTAYAAEATITILAGSQFAGCEAEDKCWSPSTLTVAEGTTVTWMNDDSAGHTVTSGTPGATDAGTLFDSTTDPAGFLIKATASWSHTFDEEGEYPYFCQVHPWMVGKVVVTEEMAMEEGGMEGEVHTMEGSTVTATHDGHSYDVPVSVSNGSVKEITIDADFTSAVLALETTSSEGELKVTLPREMIDSKTDAGDDEFIVLVDGDEATYEETMTTDTARELTIPVPGGAEEVEIIGTQVIPEFPLAVIAVMGAVVAAAVAIGRFKLPARP